jgi:hypothetical protein
LDEDFEMRNISRSFPSPKGRHYCIQRRLAIRSATRQFRGETEEDLNVGKVGNDYASIITQSMRLETTACSRSLSENVLPVHKRLICFFWQKPKEARMGDDASRMRTRNVVMFHQRAVHDRIVSAIGFTQRVGRSLVRGRMRRPATVSDDCILPDVDPPKVPEIRPVPYSDFVPPEEVDELPEEAGYRLSPLQEQQWLERMRLCIGDSKRGRQRRESRGSGRRTTHNELC